MIHCEDTVNSCHIDNLQSARPPIMPPIADKPAMTRNDGARRGGETDRNGGHHATPAEWRATNGARQTHDTTT
jgi:hypothetical protein